ncbi:RDD family protein [Actinacidiphila yeochonensis]|uniref:RDD family protein n=1 Tax=Actinacidiphila yeochonensis TaxID=89050 RepID=UPI00068B3D00|nr:RDD family protein [Actinacidiphila yeochonensis]
MPGAPAPGYYPDPSIPRYVRYWDGSAWVPGTSRPAPSDGGAPPAARRRGGPALDESGPMFLDEDPAAPVAQYGPAAAQLPDPRAPQGGWPAAAGAPGPGAPTGDPERRLPPGPNPTAPPGPGAPRISWGAERAAAPFAGDASAPPFGGGPVGGVPAPAPTPAPAPAPARVPETGQGQGQGQGAEGPAAVPWAAQVQDLARGEGPVVPWKPVAADPFASARADARPGGLVRRLLARLVDTVLVGAVTAVAAVPLGSAAYHHAKDKVDQAKLTGRTVRVWLLDGTTGTQLGAVLAVFLVACLLVEVLPTARWGRTAGKRLTGLKVLDIEAQQPPGFGASLRRWLVRTVLDLLLVGVVGVAWCLWDRPWKQGWHDKAARTFVAGG